MQQINIRGAFLLTNACLPHRRRSPNGHVLTIAPPLNPSPRWLCAHPSYTLSEYGMTLLSMGRAAEYTDTGIWFTCLWPETYIATSAVANSPDFDTALASSRSADWLRSPAVARRRERPVLPASPPGRPPNAGSTPQYR